MIALLGLVLVGGAGLAIANGANDNGKPVATLIGSGVLSQKKGLGLAFWTTLAGSLAAALWIPASCGPSVAKGWSVPR